MHVLIGAPSTPWPLARSGRKACREAPRRLGALAAAGALVMLTGCGSTGGHGGVGQAPAPAQDTAQAASPPAAVRGTDQGTCFDVIELYSGLVLLPMSTHDGDGRASVVRDARASIADHRDRMPAPVRSAFDRAAGVLDGSGETLQPSEAAQLRRALEPVKSWVDQQCAAVSPGASPATPEG